MQGYEVSEFDFELQHNIIDGLQNLLDKAIKCEPLNVQKISMLSRALSEQTMLFDSMGMNIVKECFRGEEGFINFDDYYKGIK